MRIDPEFLTKIAYLDLDSLETSPDTIYIVDGELRLRAHNHAWTTFARNNNGQAVLTRYQWGDPIDAAFPEDLKEYYRKAYRQALRDNKPFEHIYECSSPDRFRRFRQSAYPLVGAEGLVIANHLVEERDHQEPTEDFDRKYINHQGQITQCCHCRKVRDPANTRRWIWVPALVERPVANLSHTLCPRCLDFYYPDLDRAQG